MASAQIAKNEELINNIFELFQNMIFEECLVTKQQSEKEAKVPADSSTDRQR